jgi:hypothetical protein
MEWTASAAIVSEFPPAKSHFTLLRLFPDLTWHDKLSIRGATISKNDHSLPSSSWKRACALRDRRLVVVLGPLGAHALESVYSPLSQIHSLAAGAPLLKQRSLPTKNSS